MRAKAKAAAEAIAEKPAPAKPGPAIRPAVRAGDFYPAEAEALRREVESYLPSGGEKIRALACLVPHDSYIFSGPVAGAVYARLQLPPRFVILCPNHAGKGQPLAIMSEGAWQTPLGEARIDRELASELYSQFRLLREDPEAHRLEHAVEVQLPFLQVMRPDFTFVPISVSVGQYDTLAQLGETLATVVGERMQQVLIVVSSDMNHYESEALTRTKDEKVIEKMLALDPQGTFEAVGKYGVSMCGSSAAIVMLTAAKWMGAQSAELVKYATTGDRTGEHDTVVGYAGVVVR